MVVLSIPGIYFFIETSQKQGDKAWLVSQSFFNSRKCLTFYYHIYGNNIGSLNVYRKIYGNKYSVWSKSGNQGNAWLKAQVYVDGIYYTYKVHDFMCDFKTFHWGWLDEQTIGSGRLYRSFKVIKVDRSLWRYQTRTLDHNPADKETRLEKISSQDHASTVKNTAECRK